MSDIVHNYYEQRVFDELERQLKQKKIVADENGFADMSCVALNRLPPRYVRYAIDATFYSTPEEMRKMEENVINAIEYAIDFITRKAET